MLNCSCDSSRWMYRLLSSRLGMTTAGVTGCAASTTGMTSMLGSTTGAASGASISITASVSPSVFMMFLLGLLPFLHLGGTDSEIGKDAVSTCTFESSQGFENHPFTQPAILDRSHVHSVLAADLVDEGRNLELVFDPIKDVQVRHARLDHDHVGAFSQIRCHFVQRFVAVGRIHLVRRLVRLAQVQGRANGIAKWTIVRTGVFCRISHDPHVDVIRQFQCFTDGLNTTIH